MKKHATHGVSFSQAGFCGQRHFSSLALAEKAYQDYCAEMRKIYGTPGHQWTGQYQEHAIDIMPTEGRVVKGVRFVPLKKNGKPGVRVHTVQLYVIPLQQAESYLNDFGYQVEA